MPVGLIRRKIFRADPLLIKEWKKNNRSAFKTINYSYQKSDIIHPY
ncbi:Membrane protein (fragment) [Desulfamplus magnetovallimortis]|uniref:Membrane protein n=1 Tax=Desulfamplus magnetovallimortis TaxID=1246637 RepID=A0A1W1HBX4_9BACT